MKRSLIAQVLSTFILSISCILYSFGQAAFEKDLQRKLIMAEEGETIEIPAGIFQCSKTLSLDGKKKIRIKGAGMDKTHLSFAGQIQGAEGLHISNGSDIILQDFSISDAKGDCIKATNIERITFLRVKAFWTGKPKKTNGSYAIYPVQCQQVMIDSCTAIGASDAGIYVGQSEWITVRNSYAYNNVAGIEIENSKHADVYQNISENNTGGILVFDLPDLPVKKGGFIRVFSNEVRDNNFPNFAPKGNIVAKVPKGTGVLILAAEDVEVFNNRIQRNNTAGCGIISYFMTENPIKDTLYNPYPARVYVHDNLFKRDHVRATHAGRMGKIFQFKMKFGKDVPHIIWDGIVKGADGKPQTGSPQTISICVRKNVNQTTAIFNAASNFKNIDFSSAPFDCTLPNLPNPMPRTIE